MTAIIIAAVLLILMGVLAWTPVGIQIILDAGIQVRAQVGIVRVTVYPLRNSGKTKKGKKPAPTGKGQGDGDKSAKKSFSIPSPQQVAYTIETFMPLFRRVLHWTGQHLQVRQFHLQIAFGGDDPADVALLYGKAQAAVSALLPQLERLIHIKKTQVLFSTDYQADRTEYSGILEIRLHLGALLLLAVSTLRSVTVWLRGYRAMSMDRKAQEQKQSHPADAASAA